jgi:hypothetical protein
MTDTFVCLSVIHNSNYLVNDEKSKFFGIFWNIASAHFRVCHGLQRIGAANGKILPLQFSRSM